MWKQRLRKIPVADSEKIRTLAKLTSVQRLEEMNTKWVCIFLLGKKTQFSKKFKNIYRKQLLWRYLYKVCHLLHSSSVILHSIVGCVYTWLLHMFRLGSSAMQNQFPIYNPSFILYSSGLKDKHSISIGSQDVRRKNRGYLLKKQREFTKINNKDFNI